MKERKMGKYLVDRGEEEQRRKMKTLFGEGKVGGGRYLEKEIIWFAREYKNKNGK